MLIIVTVTIGTTIIIIKVRDMRIAATILVMIIRRVHVFLIQGLEPFDRILLLYFLFVSVHIIVVVFGIYSHISNIATLIYFVSIRMAVTLLNLHTTLHILVHSPTLLSLLRTLPILPVIVLLTIVPPYTLTTHDYTGHVVYCCCCFHYSIVSCVCYLFCFRIFM